MFSPRGDAGAAPGLALVHSGALSVDNTLVPEGELTGCPGRGGTGRDGEGLRGAGGGGGDGAVAPAVGHHAAVSVGGGGTPGDRGVSVGALVVRHTCVAEGKDTAGT